MKIRVDRAIKNWDNDDDGSFGNLVEDLERAAWMGPWGREAKAALARLARVSAARAEYPED
jgi:hypothetical protein